MTQPSMSKIQIHLTDQELEFLEKEILRLGISKAELIRRYIDEHIPEMPEKI